MLWGATNNTLGSEFASVAAVITNSKYVDSVGNPQTTPAGPDPWMGLDGNLAIERNGNMQSSWCGVLSVNVDPTTIATIALCAIEMASVVGLPHSDNAVLRMRARVARLGGIVTGIEGPQYIARSGAV